MYAYQVIRGWLSHENDAYVKLVGTILQGWSMHFQQSYGKSNALVKHGLEYHHSGGHFLRHINSC